MSNTVKMPTERRERTKQTVAKLLRERQRVLVLFCQVAGLEPYTPDKHKPVLAQLQEFCQLLVDYSALLVDYSAFGHFEIYDRIGRGEERRAHVARVAEALYPQIVDTTNAAVAFNDKYDPQIVETTNAAVAFNDKYDPSDHPLSLERLSEDLSALGQSLATRIEMEDRLIAALVERAAA